MKYGSTTTCRKTVCQIRQFVDATMRRRAKYDNWPKTVFTTIRRMSHSPIRHTVAPILFVTFSVAPHSINYTLYTVVDKHHPNIYEFLDKLLGEQARTETLVQQLIAGAAPVEVRQKVI